MVPRCKIREDQDENGIQKFSREIKLDDLTRKFLDCGLENARLSGVSTLIDSFLCGSTTNDVPTGTTIADRRPMMPS